MKKIGTRAFALLAVALVAAIGAMGVIAYSSASGAGTATVGAASNIVLSSAEVGDLYPDGPDVPVTVDIENPGAGAQYVDEISGEVLDNGLCLGEWFEVDAVIYGATLAPSATDSAATVVRMLDSGSNQNACQNLTMTIDWSSN